MISTTYNKIINYSFVINININMIKIRKKIKIILIYLINYY